MAFQPPQPLVASPLVASVAVPGLDPLAMVEEMPTLATKREGINAAFWAGDWRELLGRFGGFWSDLGSERGLAWASRECPLMLATNLEDEFFLPKSLIFPGLYVALQNWRIRTFSNLVLNFGGTTGNGVLDDPQTKFWIKSPSTACLVPLERGWFQENTTIQRCRGWRTSVFPAEHLAWLTPPDMLATPRPRPSSQSQLLD